MGLERILGQPVLLGGQTEKNNECDTRSGYCVPYNQSEDSIFVLMKQTPCDDTLVTNGDFATDTDWTITGTDQWTIVDGKICASVGTVETFSQVVGSFTVFDKFVINLTVQGMTAGSLEVYLGGSLVKTITENGIYAIYVGSSWSTDELLFSKSADFDGCVDSISLFKLLSEQDITANIIGTDSGVVTPMNLAFFNEYIHFSIPASSLSEGCYVIMITDPCGTPLSFTEILTDTGFDSPSDWVTSSDGNGTASITGSTLKQTLGTVAGAGGYTRATASQPFPSLTGRYLIKIVYETGTIDASTAYVNVQTDDNTIRFEQGVDANTTYTQYSVVDLDPSILETQITIRSVGASGDINELKSCSIQYIPFDSGLTTSLSNCLKVLADTTGLKVVEGISDEHLSLGFYFETGYFSLKARLQAYFQNPHTAIKSDSYLKSNGVRGKQYAQVSKAWDLVFGEVDENMHDTIANIISCDHFTIDGVEYISDEKDYQPNWGNKSAANVAESVIEVSKAEGTRFNTNV